VLVITRTKGQAFTVDGPARVEIKAVFGRYVSVAIDAPQSTAIVRCDAKTGDKRNTQDRIVSLIQSIQSHREAAQQGARELASLAGLADDMGPDHFERLAEIIAKRPGCAGLRETLNQWARESWQA